MSETATLIRAEQVVTDDLIECITQSPDEPSPPEFLDVCTIKADLIACSFRCPEECGGHPICRPCFELARQRGDLYPRSTPDA